MADRMIQRACERFQKDLSPQQVETLQSTTLDDVKIAISQVERELAARQSLRNLQRITPFIDAIDRYSKAIEVAANGTPYLPWLWAPLKLVLQGVYDCTHALDKILVAYGHIGNTMPRLTRYADAFPRHSDFQQLIAFLFEDILEFHRKAYSMIRKPGWKFYFSSLWGLFEHRYDGLLQNITRISELIGREAVAIDISQAATQRQIDLDASIARETRWKNEQLLSVLDWLEAGDTDAEMKLEWLRGRCHEGTAQWITKSLKLRSWLQRERGPNLLWIHGKPGSGKSVLSSQIIYFLRSNRRQNVVFSFCDFHTPVMGVTAYILKSICSQLIRLSPELVPFVYEEYISKGRNVVPSILKEILPKLMAHFENVCLVIDGIDESPQGEHRSLIKTICELTDTNANCKTLIVSQDIPSIATCLSKRQRLCLSDEKDHIQEDIGRMVDSSLSDINSTHEGAIEEHVLPELREKILEKADGMFLWVRLVLELLENAISVEELRFQLNSLPEGLAEAYERILGNMINKCSATRIEQIRRVFSWLLCQRGKHPLRKHQIRLGMGIYPGFHILTKATRPFPNATDICKPFIEDDLSGSLVFSHSTVPQFLIEHGKPPFINMAVSQRIVAFACIAQLNQALDLFTYVHTVPKNCDIHVCLGLVGLLPYASEHWLDHMLEYQRVSGNEPLEADELINQLSILRQKLVQIGGIEAHSSAGKSEPWMTCLNQYPEIRDFVELLAQKKSGERRPNGPSGRIPTVTRIVAKYHEIVQHILGQNSLPDVSDLDLIWFKEDYAPIAFVCPNSGCDRSVIGFQSKKTS